MLTCRGTISCPPPARSARGPRSDGGAARRGARALSHTCMCAVVVGRVHVVESLLRRDASHLNQPGTAGHAAVCAGVRPARRRTRTARAGVHSPVRLCPKSQLPPTPDPGHAATVSCPRRLLPRRPSILTVARGTERARRGRRSPSSRRSPRRGGTASARTWSLAAARTRPSESAPQACRARPASQREGVVGPARSPSGCLSPAAPPRGCRPACSKGDPVRLGDRPER